MDYNIDLINKYMSTFSDFVGPDGFFGNSDAEDFINTITLFKEGKDFVYDTGVTKLVIIPKHEKYVIKIPFSGSYNWVGDYEPFYGASGPCEDNYCEAELDYYQTAVEEGFDEFFLPIERVLTDSGYYVYIQAKAESFCCDMEDEDEAQFSSIESRKKYRDLDNHTTITYNFNNIELWMSSCLEQLEGNVEKLVNFISFLHEWSIDQDLHRGNVGYYHNKPVIIDYGGYNDQFQD